LRVRRDPAVEKLLASLGAKVTPIEAPFEPEGGAYSAGHGSHGHPHHGAHDHCDHPDHDH
jgi:urease accessory protein